MLAISGILAYVPGLHGPVCLIRLLYHVPCPGCGLTRSMAAIWHGHLVLSFRYHPLGLPVFLVCILFVLDAFISGRSLRLRLLYDRGWGFLSRRGVQVAATLVVLGVWFLRLGLEAAGNHFFLW